MKRLIIPALIATLGHSSATFAQQGKDTTTLPGTTLEVIQVYKPEVKLPPKPMVMPVLPAPDTSRPDFTYQVPQQTLNYTYHALPLRPLALGLDTARLTLQNYVKLGLGSKRTAHADAGLTFYKNKQLEAGAQLYHISQKSNKPEGQQVSLTNLHTYGKYYGERAVWTANADIYRNAYRYYGYDHSIFEYDTDTLKQRFFGANTTIGMENIPEEWNGWSTRPSVKLSYFGDKHSASEMGAALYIPVSKWLDTSLQLQVGLVAAYTHLSRDAGSKGNPLAGLNAGVAFHRNNFSGHIYLQPTIGLGGDAYLLPDIEAGIGLAANVRFTAGWKGTLLRNTYEELAARNPFLKNDYTVQQTQRHEVFARIDAGLGSNTSIYAGLSHVSFNKLPVFVNEFTPDTKRFDLLYPVTVRAWTLKAGIRYGIAETINLYGDVAYYRYYKQPFEHLWHMPSVDLKAGMQIKMLDEKLLFDASLQYLAGIWSTTVSGDVKLKPVIDLTVGAEYAIVSRLSAFVQINNLLGRDNVRYYGYPAIGLNMFGGVRFRF